MTRDQALQRLTKLRAITVERGATRPEAALAAQRAGELIARCGLAEAALPVRCAPARPLTAPPLRAYAAAGADRRSPRALRFMAFG